MKRGFKHYPPSAIMTGAQLHMSQLQLKFGSYCQVAEDVTPCNSLAARTCGAISMDPSGNLSGGQCFLALDTGKMIVRNFWKELPMTLAVINRVNVLGHAKCSLLVFTDCHGQVIGDYTPTAGKTDDTDASVLSAVNDLYSLSHRSLLKCQECSWVKKAVLMSSQEWRFMILPLFPSPQEWIWVVLNLNLPK